MIIEKAMRITMAVAGVLAMVILVTTVISIRNTKLAQAGCGGFTAPAVPIEARDAEEIFQAGFAVKVKPITVEITKWSEAEITPGDQTFTITAVAKNHSSELQEVIYYMDYSPETPTPLFSGMVTIDRSQYVWGQKVPIRAGAEQILYISLSPAPWFPGPNQNGDLQIKLRVIRWLGPRG